MAPNLEIHEDVHQDLGTSDSGADMDLRQPAEADDEPAGYIVYLTQRELLEAYPRAKRDNPGALVHFERLLEGDLWSLEVYKSEAAKHAYLVNFYYREKLLSTLTLLQNDERPHHA
jgi:hypothetical protein